jgi:hypothetical protein
MYQHLRDQWADLLIFAGLSFVFALTKLVLSPESQSIRVSMIASGDHPNNDGCIKWATTKLNLLP